MFKENEIRKKIIILGGNNKSNISWLKKMEKVYSKDYDVISIYFDNWTLNSDINFDIELKKLINITSKHKDYIIVAKSAGAILSLQAIATRKIKPKKTIIMGIPLKYANSKKIDIKDLILRASFKSKILVIQQKYDPEAYAKELKEILPENIDFKEINGNHHTYLKIEDIKSIVDSFVMNDYS